jgi:hypothetical protein
MAGMSGSRAGVGDEDSEEVKGEIAGGLRREGAWSLPETSVGPFPRVG